MKQLAGLRMRPSRDGKSFRYLPDDVNRARDASDASRKGHSVSRPGRIR